MLVELRIRNVAVIDTVSLPLAAGLNVLSGETGAGKSIIVGALGMLLGERAAADRVRAGADKGFVEGVFDVQHMPKLRAFADERGIDATESLLVLRREIGSNGRSRAWINGSPVTAALLAELGSQLVSVHGQHDSRQLLDGEHQRDVLDAFAGAQAARDCVRHAYEQLATLRARVNEVRAQQADAARRGDYLRFIAREISDTNPAPDEDRGLDDEIRRLSHSEALREMTTNASECIAGDGDGMLARLSAMRRAVQGIVRVDPAQAPWLTVLESVTYTLDELARELQAYGDALPLDPARLRDLERRRDAVLSLMRKYGPTIDDVLREGSAAQASLALLDGGSEALVQITERCRVTEGELQVAAATLTQLRRAFAAQLSTDVSALLPELGMSHGTFSVHLDALDAVGAHGAERVEFRCALNVGNDARPLQRIASGGELSRLLLALSTVLARFQQVPTLIFDEVDAGIGGAVAWQVGALMRRVAGHHQVLAISHVAQIAARAHHHIVVRKGVVGAVTTADTSVVTRDERVVEIARMLGGDADREVSRAHARELLERGALEVEPVPTGGRSKSARAGTRRA